MIHWDKRKNIFLQFLSKKSLFIQQHNETTGILTIDVSEPCRQTLAYRSSKWNVHHRSLNADKMTPEEINQIDENLNEKLKDVDQRELIMSGLVKQLIYFLAF